MHAFILCLDNQVENCVNENQMKKLCLQELFETQVRNASDGSIVYVH